MYLEFIVAVPVKRIIVTKTPKLIKRNKKIIETKGEEIAEKKKMYFNFFS